MVQSILVMLFCCMPGGIIAMINAMQVDSKMNAGDEAGARRASNNARTWCMISLGVGIAQYVITSLVLCAVIASGAQ